MPEPNLFTLPIAHRDDPRTSYAAGDRMIRNGELSRQEREVFKACKDYCVVPFHTDFTAKDIAGMLSIGKSHEYNENYHKVQRRFTGLKNKGKIVRTNQIREDCHVWEIVNGKG
jgi:hypothetical protein